MTPRRTLLLAPLAGVLLAACRAGLPPEPPGADPADANAAAPPFQAQPNPYETSAFAGEEPSRATGHEHMNHGAMTGHENMDHGAKPKPPRDTDAMPHDMHMPSEPPR